jgi:ribonucleoside-diphosphate reductase alpha chain
MKGTKILSDIKFYNDYSKYDKVLGRKQTWEEKVESVMEMHIENPKFKEAFKNQQFVDFFNDAVEAYKDKLVLASQRSLQFSGKPIMKHNAKMYNCTVSYCDRSRVFQEAMYMLLCGCGVGMSFMKEHVAKMPTISRRTNGTKTYLIEDSIEGWSDAIGVLMSSYFDYDQTFPEYENSVIHFDYSQIRPKGALISGGFKAPGPDGLKQSLERIEKLMERIVKDEPTKWRPIDAYDILMHSSDAVLSGGVRRSATIALFSHDDEEMMNAKTGNWLTENSQRSRSNNSVVLIKDEIDRIAFDDIFRSTKEFGEPGFVFSTSAEVVYNPCVEIGMVPRTIDGRSGWQVCNLTEINGGKCNDAETFYKACVASAFIGTLQASYTDFKYLTPESKEICDREALIGCSITGFMNNPKILFDPEILAKGAEIIKSVNEVVATIIGINKAARTTCVKPSGNASVLLETTSGIHGDHSKNYFRIMQINKEEEIAQFLKDKYPDLIEDSVWSSTNADYALFIPIKADKKTMLKEDLLGIKQLEYVKLVQQHWVENGTNKDLCLIPSVRHNVSNTITVDNWEEVQEYIWDNKKWFSGISLLPHYGDKVFNQAPFTEVLEVDEIIEKYGHASMFVSGMIVDALHLFDNNLWKACDYLVNDSLPIDGTRQSVLLKKDWISKAKKFSKKYFSGIQELTFCMKDVHLAHKWMKTSTSIRNLDVAPILTMIKPEYVEVNKFSAVACSGNSCEITYL